MNSSERTWLIPMEVDAQAIEDLGLDRKSVRKVKIGSRMAYAALIPCTEQQYRAYMRAEWSKEQCASRKAKCLVPSEKTGKLIRCTKSCRNCDRMRSGAPLSLDSLMDGYDYEPKAPGGLTTNECDRALTLILIEEILGRLRKQSQELALIFTMLLEGATHQAIAEAIGKPRQTTTEIINRLRKQLQETVSRDEISG